MLRYKLATYSTGHNTSEADTHSANQEHFTHFMILDGTLHMFILCGNISAGNPSERSKVTVH